MANYFNQLSLREQLEQLGKMSLLWMNQNSAMVSKHLKERKNRYCGLWSSRVESRFKHA